MKPRFLLIRVIHLALCGSLLLAGCPGTADVGGKGSMPALTVQGIQVDAATCQVPPNADELIDRALELVNEARTSRGLHPLTLNPVLCQIADDYCCEMMEGGFFEHVNPYTGEGPGQRAINAGYVFLAIGENLAGGQSSPEQVMAEWMASTQGHRENVLAYQWQEIGIGVRTGGEYGVYWVQEFGNPP